MITTEKSGIVEFRNQRDIIADRKKKTEQEYRELQKRVGKIINHNYQLVQSSISDK
ncbi:MULTISPECIES: hypothetical protein [Bacillus]|uniref:hypothetical protein n=1 Tax=Bacillus TaxID=1386 RepID=UPI0015E0DA12|nr:MULTISPECIES: hypothetical protein [Bacillus]